jgi:hypothetical protein
LKHLLIITIAVLLSTAGIAQDDTRVDDPWAIGFNLHKIGFRSPFYVGHENIRVGYWFHRYHHAGVEFGTLRTNIVSPIVGPYYRFQALDGKIHPFFEGSAKILFTRTTALERARSFVGGGYVGVNIELSDRFSIEAAFGRSTIDWDQYMGLSYRFGG